MNISDTGAKCILEFTPPPDGATAISASVQSRGATSLPVTDLPTYRLIRWKDFGAIENMSVIATDDHDGTGGDWVTDHETVLTVNAHATVDLTYRYGILVRAAFDSDPLTMGFYFVAKLEGTTAKITGT